MKKMKFKFFLLAMVCAFTAGSQDVSASPAPASGKQDVHIYKIESLDQIAASQPARTVYFFDIDDTLFDLPFMLGSKAWRKYIASATKNDPTQNWHDIFSLFIARYHHHKTVETHTSQFIQKLQNQGYDVLGLTARERQVWYDTPTNDIDSLTTSQLESVGISFQDPQTYAFLSSSPEYFKGTFFADTEPKGEYLLKLFKGAPELPEKVIFIDDKLSQVESVASALNQLGINYECYWYVATDKKASQFDPLIANIQLYYFWTSKGQRIISDDEARSIAKEHPDLTAEYYLRNCFSN